MPLVAQSRRHPGFTLVELVAALSLGLIVSGAAVRLLLVAQRAAVAQAERAAAQENVRAGALIVANELRDLGFDSVPPLAGLPVPAAASSDIVLLQSGRIRYRATRGFGFVCGPPGADRFVVRATTWMGLRQPVAGVDSLALHVEGDPATIDDDAWVRARVGAVAAGSCPDGARAIVLTVSWENPAVGPAAAVRAVDGAPVRLFEVMEIASYRSDGATWLGQRSLSRGEVLQPMVGPLADSTATTRGFRLEYLDRGQAPTAVASEVRSIVAVLRGVTARPVWMSRVYLPVVDTVALVARIALRNAVRP